jgi:hypothetical protein
MTAQYDENIPAQSDDATTTDPLGPITLPKRGKVGARAFALVGTASVAAMAFHAFADGCTTFTTQDPA